MKVSEITPNDIAEFIVLDDWTETEIDKAIIPLLAVAKAFMASYTGIPITSTDETVKTLDDYEDFYIVVMILCQDMFDNRTMYVDSREINKVVETILDMHSTNLL